MYSVSTIGGTLILWNQPWFWDCSLLLADFPEKIIPFWVEQFLFWDLALYASSLVFLFIDPRRSDFVMMLVHHLCVPLLMIMGLIFRYHRMAFISLWIHDIGDMCLELAKFFDRGRCFPFNYFFFILVPFAWFIRLTLYPYLISAVFETLPSPLVNLIPFLHIIIIRVGVVIIWILNLLWFVMILQQIYRVFWHGTTNDVRSEDEAEGVEPEQEPNDLPPTTQQPPHTGDQPQAASTSTTASKEN